MHRISGRNNKASTENENRREGVKGKNPDHGTDSSVERLVYLKSVALQKSTTFLMPYAGIRKRGEKKYSSFPKAFLANIQLILVKHA